MSAAVCAVGVTTTALNSTDLGNVKIERPTAPITGFVVVFSGNTGITEEDRAAAQLLLNHGYLVATVSTDTALKQLNAATGNCIYLPGPLEWLSQTAQRDAQLPQYMKPFLLGRQYGASLVYAALAQAPPLGFAGGVGTDFQTSLPLKKTLCNLATTTANDQLVLATDYKFNMPWKMTEHTNLALADDYWNNVNAIRQEITATEDASIADLPLVEVSSAATNNILAIIYSGDGGWRDLDRTLGDLLKVQGYAVLGMDALRYFWEKKTPERIATDLARIIEHYTTIWKLSKVVLIGFSFGAEVLPFAYTRLPAAVQDRIIFLSLLAPSKATNFEIKVMDWLANQSHPESSPILPELRKIAVSKIQCIYGDEESEETVCNAAELKQADIIKLPGGHHFDENYQRLTNRIMAGIKERYKP